METMNASLQKQLALYYDVSMNIVFDPDKKELTFINNGRTNIALWGTKAGEDAAQIEKEGRTIPPNGGFTMGAATTCNFMTARFPKPSEGSVPYEVYIKNERREEFVLRGNFGMSWQGDAGKLTVQTTAIMPEHWTRTNDIKRAAGKMH